MTTAPTTPPARAAVPPEHRWNAESVYPSRPAWQAEFKAASEAIPGLSRFQGHLTDGPAALADWMETFDSLFRRVYKLLFYANMEQAVDSTDQEAQAMAGQAAGLFSRALAAAAFAEPELLQIGQPTLESWIRQEPRLAHLGQYMHNLFRKQAHVRSAEVEELLGLAADPFTAVENTAELLANADLTFQPAASSDGDRLPVNQGTFPTLLKSPDREARRTAWESYSDGYLAFKNTFASNYAAAVKRDVFYARARRHASSLEASLFEDNIPPAVFHNLIDTFKRHIPTWHRYWAVRRRALGVETLHPYDIWAPLTSQPPSVVYTEAVEWISAAMRPLGDDYAETLRRGCLEERWVDIYPNLGKRQGAFSYGAYDTAPFIMMSYDDSLGAMSTLAHELGHSMHSYYTRKAQPMVYAGYSLFAAEVASNFNQAMTRAYLMERRAERDFLIALIEEAMSNFHRYFFIMPTLARFELEVHQRVERGQGVTADDLNALMADLFSEGYGQELHVDRARVGITWAQFPHLYSSYYVYAYATGISAAHALAEKVRAGEPGAAENYRRFLSAGSSLYAMDALRLAGVDMTTPQAVEQTFAVLARYVDRLDELTRQVAGPETR